MENESANNKRIAKNTLLLYTRTAFTMVISLFTSRVVLATLGIDDYGIYNVVGGVVAMFTVISGSLSSTISRFITFELGHGDNKKLKRVFTTSINIQIGISLIILILGETIGLWFLNHKMNIPTERMYAANWVLQCSLATFIINLISVPYNATIIAHEKMSAFAYVSILEVSLKLAIVYMLYISPIDKLITYAILLVIVALIIRIVYGVYCKHHFTETNYTFIYDKVLTKEMTRFAGLGFFTNTAYMFNTQGINILINLFFGVGVNAARGIAVQVESAMMKFVNDFTTAINPQITKSYASGNIEEMNKLVIRGAKFSFFLIFLISLPILMEAESILKLWLKEVPEHTIAFIRLATIGTMIDRLGNTGYTACMATGNIKKYVLWITSVGCLVFPITYLAYKLGSPVETTYIIYSFIYIVINGVRLWIMKGLLNFPISRFIKDVLIRISLVSIISCIIPLIIIYNIGPSFTRVIITIIVSVISSLFAIYYCGLTPKEREVIYKSIIKFGKSRV